MGSPVGTWTQRKQYYVLSAETNGFLQAHPGEAAIHIWGYGLGEVESVPGNMGAEMLQLRVKNEPELCVNGRKQGFLKPCLHLEYIHLHYSFLRVLAGLAWSGRGI